MSEKSNQKKLNDLIKQYHDLQIQQDEKLEQMKLSLRGLEKTREDILKQATDDNAVELANKLLDDSDIHIAQLHSEILDYQGRIRENLQAERKRILHMQEITLKELSEKNRDANIKLLQIRKMEIPKAEAKLNQLNDRAIKMDGNIKAIMAEIDSINDLKLEDIFQGK